jgi:hypothetical protein
MPQTRFVLVHYSWFRRIGLVQSFERVPKLGSGSSLSGI